MGKNKLQRFAEIAEFDHVLELTDYQDNGREKPKGRWNKDLFKNDHPITLELACGRGEYTIELAERNKNRNYVGVDIKGARIWKGAKMAIEKGLDNVRFLRIYIDHLDEYFGENEVDEIWITFPDPYLKWSDRNKRLTAPKFLSIYQRVLADDGVIHFKTDSDDLFDFTQNVLDEKNCDVQEMIESLHDERPADPLLSITTYYEKMHLKRGKSIKYLKFVLPEETIGS